MTDPSSTRTQARRPAEFVPATAAPLCLRLFAAVLLTTSLTYTVGSVSKPGPGMWPALVSVLVMCLCLTLLLVPRLGAAAEERLGPAQWRTLATAVPPLLLFPPLLVVGGTAVAIALLGFYWLRVPYRCSTRYAAIWAVVFTVAIDTVFILGLAIPLPRGLIFGGDG